MNFVTKIKNLLSQNQNTTQTIAKNTFWLFSGQFFGKLIRLSIIIYAARLLGPASWGALAYAMSLVAFLTIFSDIGISAIVVRESARNPQLSNKYFSTAFFIKLIFLIIGIGILIFGAPYITNIEETRLLLPIVAFVLLFDSFRNFGFSISRAKEKMQWEGANEILTNITIASFGFFLLWVSPTSQALALSYVIATGIGFLVIAWQLKDYFKNLLINFDYSLVKPILTMGWPLVFLGSLGAIMINTDLVMISWLRSAEEVGFYSAALRPIQLLYVFASLFAISLFPTFSRLANRDNEKFRSILETALKVAILIALPIALGGIVIGDQIINLLFGAVYQNAQVPFQILAATILIIFPASLVTNALFTYNQQRKFIAFSALGVTGNIMFNFLLIPPFGIIGCAFSTIFSQIIANGFLWQKMKKINPFTILDKIKKIVIASLITIVGVWLLKYAGTPVLLTILFSLPFYFLLLKIQKEELLVNLLK